MVRIIQDVSIADAMDRILIEKYAGEPPTSYKKQVRIQIKNAALQSEEFCNELETEIMSEFADTPCLDDIEELLDNEIGSIEDVLARYGVIEWAKKFSPKNKKTEGGAK